MNPSTKVSNLKKRFLKQLGTLANTISINNIFVEPLRDFGSTGNFEELQIFNVYLCALCM